MKRGRSNQSSTSHDDFSLPRAKILRGRKNFKRLFEQEARVFRNNYIDIRFQLIDQSTFGCLMGFVVKKSLGKANKRNKMKRLLKEAYRIHQYMLADPLRDAQVTFHGVFMAKAVDLDYKDVEEEVVALLKQVRDQLPSILSDNS